MGDLDGQTAIVTGGGSGIGRACARALAEAGAAVVVLDLDVESAAATASLVSDAGGNAVPVGGDVTKPDEVTAAVEVATDLRGSVDVVVNSAGYCRLKPILELVPDELARMWEVHVLGTFVVCRAVLPAMIERRYGRIVNVVSGPDGHGASPWTSHYQSAKAAQTSLGKSLALAVAEHGVTVNAVSPGLVVTSLWEQLDADYQAAFGRTAQEEIARRLADPSSFPLGRAVEPDEVARVVCFLAAPASAAITGEVVNV